MGAMEAARKRAVAFARSTRCHGLEQVFEPGRSLLGRLVWVIVLCALFGGMCWQLTVRVQEYVQYATDTELREEFENYMDFPAVSICNYNRFFNVTDHDELAAVDGLIRLASPTRKKENDKIWGQMIRDYYRDQSHIPLLSKEVEDRGWPLNEETIVSCMFHSKPCSYANFTSFTTSMGRCFTFTSEDRPMQSVPGSGHGLLLTLNIMQDYYTEHPEYGRPEAGVKVHVHEHNESPMVEEFGISVPAGEMGHLILKKEERHLMYPPWGNCNPNPKKMKYMDRYSFGECMTECRSDHIIQKCGCKPYWASTNEPIAECDVWRILSCSGSAEAESMKLSPGKCGCDNACKSIVYDHRLSYATYPSVGVGEILVQYNQEKDTLANETAEIESKIVVIGKQLNLTETDPYRLKLNSFRDNHVMLDVHFESLSYIKITQSKKVTEISLTSDFGGLLGLWLGISIVTLGEFIQFFFQMCISTAAQQTIFTKS